MLSKAERSVSRRNTVRQPAGSRAFDIAIHVILVIVGLICLLPFLHVAAMSFSSKSFSPGRRPV